jgi:hypothetical protein
MPDGSMKILSVNLRDALAGNPLDNVLLQPRDRILVHRKPLEVDPPNVAIKGEVAKPGRYPFADNMHVSDLIRAAGGFKRSAAAETTDLTRYPAPESGQPEGKHYPLNLAAALTGGQVIGQAGVGGFLVHFEVPRESSCACHPGVLKKSAEAVDCKRVVKHSWFKERKERAKSALRSG